MNKYIVVPSIRPELAFKFMKSFTESHLPKQGWKVVFYLQGYSNEDRQAIHETGACWLDNPEKISPYEARYFIMKHFKADYYAFCDDDMIILPNCNFDKMVERASKKEVGLVTSLYRDNQGSHLPLRDKLKPRTIVYTAGGIVFARKIRDLIMKHPNKNYLMESVETSLLAYTNGYNNFQYYGSLNEHNCDRKGPSIKTTRAEVQMTKNTEEWITLRPYEYGYKDDNNYTCGRESDITELAHKLHNDNYKGN